MITVMHLQHTVAEYAHANYANKKVILKNCSSCANYLSKINNTQEGK